MSDCLKHDSKKMTQTLSQVAAALGVDLVGEDRMFSQVSINTRTMEKGDLFIALKGENFDAHDYLQQAEEKGACGLVIEQCYNSVLPQIKVDNSRVALGDIASLWSSAFTLPIIAITGSCGKTTVKEMTAAILGHGFKSTDCESDSYEHVLATRGNLNNDIGVPLTLLRLNCEHKAAVIELGANHIGEIKQLVNMVQPNVALITNVHPAHIEGFGSIEGIAQAKSEIYEGLEDMDLRVRKFKFLPYKLVNPVPILVWEDSINYQFFRTAIPFVIEIKNKELRDSTASQFEMLWKMAKK